MKDIDLKSHAIGMILKAVGVEPSLSGLIQAAGGKPEEVFQAVALTVEMAPKVITAVMEMDARMKRIEHMVECLCADSGITIDALGAVKVHRDPALDRQVAQAAMDEASGRS